MQFPVQQESNWNGTVITQGSFAVHSGLQYFIIVQSADLVVLDQAVFFIKVYLNLNFYFIPFT